MSNEGTVNSVITDSVTQTNTGIIGGAASQAMGLIDVVSAETLGMSMYNAVTTQQNAQMSASASVTATCAKMLQTQIPQPAPVAEPEKDTPPPFMPLSNNTNLSPSAMLAQAQAAAKDAIDALNKSKNDADVSKEISTLIATLESYKNAAPANSDTPEKTNSTPETPAQDPKKDPPA